MLGSYEFSLVRTIPSDQELQFIAIRAIGLKGFLIKQSLDATAQADLVGITLGANRPAHLAVPASPEENDGHSSQAGGHYTDGPHPVLLLTSFFPYHNL